jgi:signal transduction histidine kinase
MNHKSTANKKDIRLKIQGHTWQQPLAAGLVCLVFVLLFFLLAMAGSRGVSLTLQAFLFAKGQNVIEIVEGAASEKIIHLKAITTLSSDPALGIGELESFYEIHESLVSALIDIGRNIDEEPGLEKLSVEGLHKIAKTKHLAGIVLLSRHGIVKTSGLQFPRAALSAMEPLWSGTRGLIVDLARVDQKQEITGWVGLRSQSDDISIVLLLDNETLDYWQSKISLQAAINEVGWRQGIRYFTVIDSTGNPVAGAGQILDKIQVSLTRSEPATPEWQILSGTERIFEVKSPIQLNGSFTGIALAGIEMYVMDTITSEHRKTIFLSMGLLIGLGLMAMSLLYISQRRHLSHVRDVLEDLHRAEHFAALGRMAAGVAHEIRNPLNAIGIAAQRMQRENNRFSDPAPHQPDNRFIDVIWDEVRRLNLIVEDFLSFAKNRPMLRPVLLADFLEDIVRLMSQEANSKNITIENNRQPADIEIEIDPDKMKQVMLNIFKNAIESIRSQGKIAISTILLPNQKVGIRVQDSGAGVLPEALEAIFEPGYTTKDKGLGLGLAIAHEIVRAHGGEIQVSGKSGAGADFIVVLPLTNLQLKKTGYHS